MGKEKRDKWYFCRNISSYQKSHKFILRLQNVEDVNMHIPLEHQSTLHYLLVDLTHQSDHIKIFSHHLIGPICMLCYHMNKKGKYKYSTNAVIIHEVIQLSLNFTNQVLYPRQKKITMPMFRS